MCGKVIEEEKQEKSQDWGNYRKEKDTGLKIGNTEHKCRNKGSDVGDTQRGERKTGKGFPKTTGIMLPYKKPMLKFKTLTFY